LVEFDSEDLEDEGEEEEKDGRDAKEHFDAGKCKAKMKNV
jgi:hypothetical protein